MNGSAIAKLIDHTLLKPDATEDDVGRLCTEAAEYRFASVCTASCWTRFVRERLDRFGIADVKVCAVAGFPFGSSSTRTKIVETMAAVDDGADEIDAVMNVGFLRSGYTGEVETDLFRIVDAAGDATVKIIIETCYLTDEQKVLAGRLVKNSGAAFVKTSTGYGPAGATVEDVALLKREVPGVRIKASGGIRNYEQVKALIDAGASRIGTSAGPAIVAGSGRLIE